MSKHKHNKTDNIDDEDIASVFNQQSLSPENALDTIILAAAQDALYAEGSPNPRKASSEEPAHAKSAPAQYSSFHGNRWMQFAATAAVIVMAITIVPVVLKSPDYAIKKTEVTAGLELSNRLSDSDKIVKQQAEQKSSTDLADAYAFEEKKSAEQDHIAANREIPAPSDSPTFPALSAPAESLTSADLRTSAEFPASVANAEIAPTVSAKSELAAQTPRSEKLKMQSTPEFETTRGTQAGNSSTALSADAALVEDAASSKDRALSEDAAAIEGLRARLSKRSQAEVLQSRRPLKSPLPYRQSDAAWTKEIIRLYKAEKFSSARREYGLFKSKYPESANAEVFPIQLRKPEK